MGNNKLTVVKITGEAFRQTEDRLLIPIQKGDLIPEGEIIIVRSGQILLMDSAGNPFELSEGSSLAVGGGPAPEDVPEPVALSPSDLPAEASAHYEPAKTAAPSTPSPGGDIEEDVVQEGHSHVRLGRIQYENNSGLDYIRDVNEVFHFDTRATRNPRVSFSYDYAEGKDPFPRSEIEDPYSGWDGMPQSGWANRPPSAVPGFAETDEDIPLILDLLQYASDPDGQPLSVISATALFGTVVINSDGTVTYTPGEDYHGTDTISYIVSDGHGGTVESTVTVIVHPVQDAFNDAVVTDEDVPVIVEVLDNDTFGPNAEVTSVTQGSHGTVVINSDGTVTYTPGEDYHGTDSFTYTVTTAAGNTETATVTVTVNPVQDAFNDAVVTDEDVPVIVEVLDNDTFGPNAEVTSVTQGSHGTVVINSDGTVTYTPGEDYHGTDSFTYTVTTAAGNTETATVTVTVNPVQDAFNDAVVTDEDVPVIVEVLDNDTFGPNAEVTSVTQGSHGTVVINSDGTVTYTPGEDYHGTDSFTYTVTTAAGNTETATVTVTVNPVQDAFNDAVVTDEDVPVIVEVLDNDTFGPNAEVTSVTQGSHGTVVINSDGTVTYTPGEDYHGTDSFTYTVTTAAGNTETATVMVTVNPVQDAFNDAVVTDEDVPVIVEVLDNDTFGPNAEVTSVTQGSHGTVVINSDGTVTYTPGEDYHGTDSFTYTVTTAAGNTETATVTVTVNPVQDAFNDAVVTDEDVPVIVEVLDNDTFGPNAEVTSVTQGSHGTVVINSDGTVTYTPGEDYHGTDSFTYTVTTAAGNTETATVTVTVNPVQDAFNDAVVTDEDVPVIVEVLDNDTFGPNAEVTSVTQGSHGTVVINSDGTVTYTPGEDYHGTDSFTYTVTTAAGNTETATVTVTVNPVQDAFNDAVVTDEDVPVIVEVLDNDTFGPNAEVTSVTQGSHGTVVINSDGTVTYTPGEDYHGTDSFTYTVTTAAGNTETATVTVTVNPVQDAFNDAVTTDEDTPVSFNVFDNDTFGPNAEVTSVTQGSHGTVSFNENGDMIYTPGDHLQSLAEGETQTDTFTYTVTTAAGNTETATVTVTINGANDAPVSTPIDGRSDFDADAINHDVSGHFSDPDLSDTLTFSAAGLPGGLDIDPATGIISGTIDRSASQHGPGDDGVYTVTVTATDPHGVSTSQTFTWTVTNPGPTAVNDFGDVTEDTAITATGNVLGNDTDPDGDDLRVDSVDGQAISKGGSASLNGDYGTVTIHSDGSYTYDLNNTDPAIQALAHDDPYLTDTFTYTITDDEGGSSSATLTIRIHGTNDAPVISVGDGDSDTGDLTETDAGLSTSGTLTLYDVDTTNTVTTAKVNTVSTGGTYDGPLPDDADLISMFSVSGSLDGTQQESPNGITWTFDSGSEAFDFLPEGKTLILTYTIRATDSYGATDDQKVTITITGTNDAPVAVADINSVTEDAADQPGYDDGNPGTTIVAGNVLDNDSDIDHGDTFPVTGVAKGTPASAAGNVGSGISGDYGTVTVNSDGSYTYSLDNTNGSVQALAIGETLTDTFTYTITDSQGATRSTTLTITINGSNDAPEIHVKGTDSDSAALTETDAGLSVGGTLSVFDVDTSDTVAATKVGTVTRGGTYTGPLPDEADLIAMFSVSGGDPSTTEQWSDHGITWTFDSKGYAFNELPAGQTLTLTYTVRATDIHGAYEEHLVTITITGTNDEGAIINDVASVDEDTTLTGNVLANDTPDPDWNEPLEVFSFTVDSDGDGTPENYTAGTTVPIITPSGTLGTLTLNADGSYVFVPHPNYSGPVPTITYNAGNATFNDDATLDITVNPVADAPKWEVHSGVETNEDEMISLNFKMPAITDNIDENGALPGDYPERLGFIELQSVDTGAKIYKGDGTTLLFTGANNTMTIVIVDEHGNLDTTVHYTDLTSDSNYGSAIKLTQAEFEALKILPPADRHNDIDMTLRVTSYETDDSGNRDTSVPGAAASRNIHVEVLAVTDDVDLKINGSDDPYSATIDEDTTLNLSSLLSANFDDLDGSEKRSIVIYNPEGNDPIAVNGTTVNGGSSITIDAPGLSTSTSGFPAISIGGAANISGDLKGITVTLRAQDTDSDSPGHTPAVKTDSVTLDLYVNPVAGDVTAPPVSTEEDTAVKFMEDLALTDTDGSEVMDSITIKEVPTGWVIKDSGGTVVHTGDGSSDYSVPVAHVSDGSYKDYTITPPAHSSADETLTVSVQTTDTKVVDGTTVTSTETVDLGVKVTVTPVAEVIGTDTDGDGTVDLTMSGDYTYTTHAKEDTWFELNQDGFDFKTPWSNQDPDEQTYALLTPKLNGGDTSAIGSQFKYFNGTSWVTLTYNGSAPVEIPVEYLDTVEFKAAPNVKGSFEIEVQAKTVDTDPDTGDKVSAVSGSATLTNGVIEPVADQVTLAVSSGLNTLEDVPVALKVRPTSSDPTETFNVTIEDIPDGAKVYYDGEELTVSSGSVTIEDFSAAKTLSILPPHNSNEDFVLKVSAVSVDSHGGIIDVSGAATLPITVNVQGVADPAILDVQNFSTTEADLDSGGNVIALSEVINSAALTDTDGSETLTLVLTGLAPEFTVEGATFTGGVGTSRVWIIDTSKLASTNIVTPENYSGTIELDVKAITTENDGDSLTGAPTPIVIEVAPSPEATITGSTTAPEDTLVPVNFSIVHQHGDTDEVLSSLWIKASDVEGKGFTLYFGNSTATTLADAAGASTPGVVLEGDYYKLTGDAIGNIYAKGAPNAHGSFDFEVKYEITDPSSDGSLPSVTEQWDRNYTFNVTAVTDQTETTITEISADNPVTVNGDEVTITENLALSVKITIDQSDDPNAGGQPDYDGSEKLICIVVDGVPNGVRVDDAVYIGNIPGNDNTGQWLLRIDPNESFDGPLTHTLVFRFEGTEDVLKNLDQTVTITARTQDTGSTVETSFTSFRVITPSNFDDTNSSQGEPASITEPEFTPLLTAEEDSPITLKDIVQFTTDGESAFSVTLTDLPDGAVVNGMIPTTIDGKTVWTASGSGGDEALQSLLASITVTPPPNWNSNNSSDFSFNASLTSYAEGRAFNFGTVEIHQPLTPVTDATAIDLSIVNALEGNDVTVAISMSNAADHDYSRIVGEKLYISLDETGMDKPGTLWYEGSQLSLTPVTGVAGVADGDYYVIEGVTDISQTVGLVYTPEAHSSGQATLTATLVGQEENASNIITNTVTGTLTVEPVNSGYDITVKNSSGNEDTKIALDFSDNGLIDNDGSESVLTAVLGNVPEGYLVFYGADEASSVAASNLGSDGFGNTSWSIPVTGGSLPAYIALLPPEHFSGTVQGLELSVYSGESTLDPTASTASFDLEVIPVADGLSITPTNTFGMEGDHIPINLNASIIDTDGSETVTLEVKGLGDHASFYSGGSLISSTTYDSGTDTYTVSGIEASKIDDLSFIQASKTGTVEVTAYTVETANSDTSTAVTGSFEIDIFERIATAGDDTLLYSGKPLDGLAGVDTVIMRFNEGIDFGTDPAIRNVEIFDLRGETSGSNTLDNLSIQDVIDITDSNNTLTIFGDANDSVNIIDDGHWIHTTETSGGIDFDVYTHAIQTDVILRIQQEMMANLVDAPPEP